MIVAWIGFLALILVVLALDLGVFHRRAHVVEFRESLGWSALWIALGLSFSVFVYFGYGRGWLGLGSTPDPVDGLRLTGGSAALKYVTGYIVEKSLSVDNIFVIATIFSFFRVPPLYQHRVLFWGILGALAMRGAMIAGGVRLIAEFHWALYVLGAFILVTGVRMLFFKPEHADIGHHPVVRLVKRFLPITEQYHGARFAVRAGTPQAEEPAQPGERALPDAVAVTARPGKLLLTPLGLALVMVETSDLLFAVDSIPAIFAITGDAFLVFTSNVFAILGLRSLYFALAGMIHRFRYMKTALALILVLVGAKMLAAGWLKEVLGPNFTYYVLAGILVILAGGVVASLLVPSRETEAAPVP